jgi:vacuolar-type H+-ATPase subunit E/Vma4
LSKLNFRHVFISYSRQDDNVMQSVVAFLQKKGLKIWLDKKEIPPGSPIWEIEIEKAIKETGAVVVLLSPDSNNSVWVRRELNFAEAHKKRIYPVLISGNERNAIPISLTSHQRVDIRDNEEAELNSLATTLGFYLEDLAKEEEAKRKAKEEEKARQKAEEQEARAKAERERQEKILEKKTDLKDAEEALVNTEAIVKKTRLRVSALKEEIATLETGKTNKEKVFSKKNKTALPYRKQWGIASLKERNSLAFLQNLFSSISLPRWTTTLWLATGWAIAGIIGWEVGAFIGGGIISGEIGGAFFGAIGGGFTVSALRKEKVLAKKRHMLRVLLVFAFSMMFTEAIDTTIHTTIGGSTGWAVAGAIFGLFTGFDLASLLKKEQALMSKNSAFIIIIGGIIAWAIGFAISETLIGYYLYTNVFKSAKWAMLGLVSGTASSLIIFSEIKKTK